MQVSRECYSTVRLLEACVFFNNFLKVLPCLCFKKKLKVLDTFNVCSVEDVSARIQILIYSHVLSFFPFLSLSGILGVERKDGISSSLAISISYVFLSTLAQACIHIPWAWISTYQLGKLCWHRSYVYIFLVFFFALFLFFSLVGRSVGRSEVVMSTV